MSSLTTTVAARRRAVAAFAIATRETVHCSSPVNQTTTTGVQETLRQMSHIIAQRRELRGRLARILAGGLTTTLMVVVPPASRSFEPKVDYQLNCMGCHLPDGSGQPGRVPSFRGTITRFSVLAKGREFIIRVPGVSQSALSDQEIALLLNWITANLSDEPLPPDFRAYTAAEVATFRHVPLAQVSAARAALIARMAAADHLDGTHR